MSTSGSTRLRTEQPCHHSEVTGGSQLGSEEGHPHRTRNRNSSPGCQRVAQGNSSPNPSTACTECKVQGSISNPRPRQQAMLSLRRHGHRQEDCPHKNSTCDYCRKTGHIDAACRKKRADQPDSTAPSSRSTQTKPTSRHTPRSAARAHNLEAEDYSEDEFFIHHNEQDTEHKRTEIWIEPSINGRSLKMELDTGSALSIIPLRLYSAHFADLELSPSSVVLKTYTGERVRPTGVPWT